MIKLVDILPPSLSRDDKFIALAKALDNALNYIHDNKDLVLLLPNLDKLPSDVLDHLAVQWHCDFYDKNLPVDIKRSMIKDSLAWHKIKGTPAAVQKILDMFMTGACIDEWFNYGGNPYYFKIFANTMRDIGDGDITFWRMLFDAKNVRSWLESITMNLPTDDFPHYHGVMEPIGGDAQFTIDTDFSNHTDLYHAVDENIVGNSFYDIDSDFNSSGIFYHGVMTCITGCETIGVDFQIDSTETGITATAAAEFYYGDEFICADYIPIDPDPLPEYDDYLKLYFNFAQGSNRIITIANPRPDVDKNDILDLSYFTAKKKILLNKQGYYATNIYRALSVFKSVCEVKL